MGLFLEITSRFGSSNLHKPKAHSLLVSWSFHLHQSHKLPVYVDFNLSDGDVLLLVSLPVAWCNAAVFLSVSSASHHFSFTANLIVLQYRSSEIYIYTEEHFVEKSWCGDISYCSSFLCLNVRPKEKWLHDNVVVREALNGRVCWCLYIARSYCITAKKTASRVEKWTSYA